MGAEREVHGDRDKDSVAQSSREEAALEGSQTGASAILSMQRLAGNQAVTQMLQGSVQRMPASSLLNPRSSDGQLASAGTSGPSTELPHKDELEDRFGTSLEGVPAHTGPIPSLASQTLGAKAYAHEGHVAFAEPSPSIETVAHEVAHLGQTGHANVPGSDHADPEADAEAVAASVTREDGQLDARKPETVRGASGPRLLTEQERQQLSGIVTACIFPLGTMLRLLGFSITAGCIGLRESATAGAAVAGSVGVDEMLFIDPIRWEITGDVVPFAEIGIGLEVGGSVGVVFGLRLSPLDRPVESARSVYAGGSIGGTVRALAGVGLSVDTTLLSGEEGWVTGIVSAGMEAGANISYGYSVSAVDFGTAVVEEVERIISGLSSFARSVNAIGEGISQAVQSMFASLFSIFDPDAWDLTGYTPVEQAAMLRFGRYMHDIIRRTSLERFLAEESASPPTPISRRIASIGDVGIFLQVSEAMNARFRRRMTERGIPAGITMDVWPAEWFTNHTYLQFLQYAQENNLLASRGAGSPPRVSAGHREPEGVGR